MVVSEHWSCGRESTDDFARRDFRVTITGVRSCSETLGATIEREGNGVRANVELHSAASMEMEHQNTSTAQRTH